MLTALASDEQTGRIYTIDARRRVNGIGTGPGTSCYATTMSASTPTGTRWRWPATAASPFEFQDVTGWVPADATAAMRASHDTCQLVEAAGRDVSRRSCRGYDSTFPPADDWANGLFCDAMPDGGDSVLADVRSGMTVITASQVAGTRDGGELSFCSVQINVTEVSVVPVTILSVVTGRQTSRRVLFSDLLLNSTGAVVMTAQAVSDLRTSLRLRYSGALTIVAGPSPETGVAEWIEVSGVFNSVIRETLIISDRGGPNRLGAVTLTASVEIQPVALTCPGVLGIDAWGDPTAVAVTYRVRGEVFNRAVHSHLWYTNEEFVQSPQAITDDLGSSHHGATVWFMVDSDTPVEVAFDVTVPSESPDTDGAISALSMSVRDVRTGNFVAECVVDLYVINVTLAETSISTVFDQSLERLDSGDVIIEQSRTLSTASSDASALSFKIGNSSATMLNDGDIKVSLATLGVIHPPSDTDSGMTTVRVTATKDHLIMGITAIPLLYQVGGGGWHLVGGRQLEVNVLECQNDVTCNGVGVCVYGDSPYDGESSCNCTDEQWSGVNCSVNVASESSSASTILTDTSSAVAVGASLGAVVLVMLAALVVFRVQVYRLKHRPVDVGATQEEVLASLGLAASWAATQDISPTELGISLLFDHALPPNGGADGGARLEVDLVAILRRAAPPDQGRAAGRHDHLCRHRQPPGARRRAEEQARAARRGRGRARGRQGRQGQADRRRRRRRRRRPGRRRQHCHPAADPPRGPPWRADPHQTTRRGRVRRGPPVPAGRTCDAVVLRRGQVDQSGKVLRRRRRARRAPLRGRPRRAA